MCGSLVDNRFDAINRLAMLSALVAVGKEGIRSSALVD